MIRKYLVPLLAFIGVALAVAMVVEDNRAVPVAKPSVQPTRAPFSSNIFGPGVVEAGSENIAVGAPVSGIVTAVYVKWGGHVNKGGRLFKIDPRDLQAQLLPASAKVQEAEANLQKVNNRLKVGEGLKPNVSISAEDLANRRYDVTIAEATLASARAQVAQIKQQIELRTVRAPISGRVLQLKTLPGEFAQSGIVNPPLILLGNETELHVRVDIDENDAWRFRPCAAAVASVRGNPDVKTSLRYVRTDPAVVPKVLLTGDATQRTDTRVLQVIYSFPPGSLPLYVGQLMDVFIEAPPLNGTTGSTQPAPCGDGTEQSHGSAARERKR
ncbi:MAG TPA: efflux RND transporter periplasmic adaptor subunit [Candidatus Angelobacter sp.]|nr:efflux RND transporter periplasmic adaptor subunit [Candidatus Angelobacter sp.]